MHESIGNTRSCQPAEDAGRNAPPSASTRQQPARSEQTSAGVAASDDFDGEARPIGSAPDVGADEYFPVNTIVYRSQSAYDGWILESGEKANKGGTRNATDITFYLGDDARDRQYRAILHFTVNLPSNAVVTSVTLKIKRQGLVGTTPFSTHGKLLVDGTEPGPGRVDAFGAARNLLFSKEAMKMQSPVSFPFLWDVPDTTQQRAGDAMRWIP